MKYFAKYIPVEGEITEHDMVYDSEDNTISSARDLLLHVDDLNHLNVFPNYSPVKLFLCSRDIHTGDEVLDLKTNKKFKVRKWQPYATQTTIKVIGKISTAATWVKEGDEFTENQLVWNYIDENGDTEDRIDWNSLLPDDDMELYTVGIKCPCCGTFK